MKKIGIGDEYYDNDNKRQMKSEPSPKMIQYQQNVRQKVLANAGHIEMLLHRNNNTPRY